MNAFQRDILRFESVNAQVLGISGDSLKTHQKFTDKYGITFPLISDKSKDIRRQYGKGRITYLIDHSGTVRHIHKGFPDNEKLIKELKQLTP